MKRAILRAVATLIFATLYLVNATGTSRAEFQFPLKSLSPVTTPFGEQRIRVAVDYNHGERLLFQEVDKNRKEFHLPIIDVAIGVSPNVELLFCYPFLYMKQDGQSYEYGSGDLKIGGVFRFLTETRHLPVSAIKFAVKLPNADDTKEFGTDQTDFFVGGVFEKKFDKVKLLVNTDFAILGNPEATETKQDDVLIYKVGLIFPAGENTAVGLEVEGVEFSRYGNDRLFIRGGIATPFLGILLDASVAAGLTEESGDFQASVGFTWKFGLERKLPSCPK